MPPRPRRPPRGAPGGRPPRQASGELKGALSLARALSKFGVCSRREAERWIAAGRVSVDGKPVRFPARRIDPRNSRVTVDGRPVSDQTERIVIALNKPVGYLTARLDPAGRPTVYDLLGELGRWVFPVGRLDRDTSGLLLFTNDHRLGQRLSDPQHHVPKTYHVLVRGLPDAAALGALREGLPLDSRTSTRPARVRVVGLTREGRAWLEVVLTEGKNRQVRRMCSAVGHQVLALTRVAVGRFPLGALALGRWRRLDGEELSLLAAAGVRRVVPSRLPSPRSSS